MERGSQMAHSGERDKQYSGEGVKSVNGGEKVINEWGEG